MLVLLERLSGRFGPGVTGIGVALLSIVAILVLVIVPLLIFGGQGPWDHEYNQCRSALYIDYLEAGYDTKPAWSIAKARAPEVCP